jgi:predicted nucleotidyltransferase component of viral defense system
MNHEYVDTVRLLLAIAPAVFQSPCFALKGGTALNLFLHDMPRLSVDIDVVVTDHALGREDALRAIAADLKAAKTAISVLGYRASLPTVWRWTTQLPREFSSFAAVLRYRLRGLRSSTTFRALIRA